MLYEVCSTLRGRTNSHKKPHNQNPVRITHTTRVPSLTTDKTCCTDTDDPPDNKTPVVPNQPTLA
jgi:hypothetical protein